MDKLNYELKIISFPKSKEEISDCFIIRQKVFIEEQKFDPLLDFDEYDFKAIHFLIFDNEKIIGNVRLIDEKPRFRISRFCVLKEYRNRGIGKILIEECLKMAQSKKSEGFEKLYLDAQIQVVDYYKKLGFIPITGDIVIIENYPHMNMERRI